MILCIRSAGGSRAAQGGSPSSPAGARASAARSPWLLAAEGADVVLVARRTEAARVDGQGDRGHRTPRSSRSTADVATPTAPRGDRRRRARPVRPRRHPREQRGQGLRPSRCSSSPTPTGYASIELNLMSAVRLSLACVPQMWEQGWGRAHPHLVARRARARSLLRAVFGVEGGADQLLEEPGERLLEARRAARTASCRASSTARRSTRRPRRARRRRARPWRRCSPRRWPSDRSPRAVSASPPTSPASSRCCASDRASWITGACFTIDGGIVPRRPVTGWTSRSRRRRSPSAPSCGDSSTTSCPTWWRGMFVDDERAMPETRRICRKLAERGWLTMAWPPEYGGRGRQRLAADHRARGDVGPRGAARPAVHEPQLHRPAHHALRDAATSSSRFLLRWHAAR